MESPIEIDDLGGTPIFGNIHIYTNKNPTYPRFLISLTVNLKNISTFRPQNSEIGAAMLRVSVPDPIVSRGHQLTWHQPGNGERHPKFDGVKGEMISSWWLFSHRI